MLDNTTALGEAMIDQTEDTVDDAAKDYEEPKAEETEEQQATEEQVADGETEEEQGKNGKGKKPQSLV